jgi:glycosyltransferase involved in cell wall biosynthesis
MEALVRHLGREVDFYVFTRDRSDGDDKPLAGTVRGKWHEAGQATVYRASPHDLSPRRMAAALREVEADAYYVNSLLSPRFGIQPVLLRWCGWLRERPMVLAPRGELHPGALRLKKSKKRSFLEVARRSPAYSRIHWQAGSADEALHIRRWFPSGPVTVARDLTMVEAPRDIARPQKRKGMLRVVTLSRITPVKNIVGAIEMVSKLQGEIAFDIYGPAEDAYLRECKRHAARVPPNVHVGFPGDVPHERVMETLAAYHVFLLPTFGESFGHAILESLVAGVPPVISDQTPWRELDDAGVGWDLPVDDQGSFVRVLRRCVELDQTEYSALSSRAGEYGIAAARNDAGIIENRALFTGVVAT